MSDVGLGVKVGLRRNACSGRSCGYGTSGLSHPGFGDNEPSRQDEKEEGMGRQGVSHVVEER